MKLNKPDELVSWGIFFDKFQLINYSNKDKRVQTRFSYLETICSLLKKGPLRLLGAPSRALISEGTLLHAHRCV